MPPPGGSLRPADPDRHHRERDVADPLEDLARSDLDRLLAELADDAVGGLLAVPARDTLKRADDLGKSQATEPRERLWRALTPQLFRRGGLTRALEAALRAGIRPTDEAMAMERLGLRPCLVEGREDNLKITTPADLALAEFLLSGGGAEFGRGFTRMNADKSG